MKYVWWQGKCVPEQDACVPVSNRGFLFGEGVFRTLKVQDGVVELFSIHLDRLRKECAALSLQAPEIDPQWMTTLIRSNHATQGSWRLKWIVPCTQDQRTELLMTLEPYHAAIVAAKLCIYPHPLATPLARYKTLSYLDRIWAGRYAQEKKCDEAVITNSEGYLMEASTANLFWRIGNDYFFPDPSLPFLEGTTVSMIQRMCQYQGWSVHFKRCPANQIPKNAQVFICNALRGIIPVHSIEGVGCAQDASFLDHLKRLYAESVESFHFKVI